MDTPKFGPRQEMIIRAAAAGLGQKEIAARLGMPCSTASTQLRKIYAKIGMVQQNREKLGPRFTAWAIQHGYGPQEDAPMKIAAGIDLFALRCAASEWLREHPENPNAPAVRKALANTQDDERPAKRLRPQGDANA